MFFVSLFGSGGGGFRGDRCDVCPDSVNPLLLNSRVLIDSSSNLIDLRHRDKCRFQRQA